VSATFNQTTKNSAFAHEVVLAGKLRKGARAHSISEGRKLSVRAIRRRLAKKISGGWLCHGGMIITQTIRDDEWTAQLLSLDKMALRTRVFASCP
jgi:hypothetical protein